MKSLGQRDNQTLFVYALGVVAHAWSYQIVVFILLCAVSLAIVRRLFSSHLRDLF